MIDWITAEIPFAHSMLNAGSVIGVKPCGEVEWMAHKWMTSPGSFESTIQIKSSGIDRDGHATHMWISGNPSKFLQGHNIFGSDDLVSLVYDTVLKIAAHNDITPNVQDLVAIRAGRYRLTRVDINYSWSLDTREDVLAVLRALENKAFMRIGRAVMKGTSLTFGTAKSRYQIVGYSKGEELQAGKKHHLPAQLLDTPLSDWADDKLRLELRLKRKELNTLDMNTGEAWTPDIVKQVYLKYVRRIDMSQQISLSPKDEIDLPRTLRCTYELYKQGIDLRSYMPHNTYYRHRRQLKEHGIDIRLTPETLDRSNVVPIFRFSELLDVIPVDVPEWAFHQGLVHPSAAQGSTRIAS